MSLLESLYTGSMSTGAEHQALRLCRYRMAELLRQVAGAPLFYPHRASLSGTLASYRFTLESAESLACLMAQALPRTHRALAWDKQPPCETVTRAEALRILVAAYQEIRERLPELATARVPVHIEANGADWLNRMHGFPGRSAVEKLVAQIEPHLQDWYSGFLIHGSVATGDIVPGFSDFDTLVLLSDAAMSSETELDEALRLLARTHRYLLQFNPYMHHSHMLALEMDLEALSYAQMPLSLFQKGAFWGRWNSRASMAQADLECVLAFRPFEWFYETWVNGKEGLNDPYEVIWWASTTVLLPLLYAQLRDGVDRWKPDALDAARPDLNASECALIDFVTEVRTRTRIPVLEESWWSDFPPDAHPGLAAQHARITACDRGWQSPAVGREVLRQSVQFFRDIRQKTLRQWRGQISPDLPLRRSSWFSLPVPLNLAEHPSPAERSHYDAVTQEFLQKVRQVEGVIAAYRFGEVGCPGLSDLDFMLVVDARCSYSDEWFVGLLSGRSAETMGHAPVVVGEEAFRLFPLVYPVFALEKLFGELEQPPLTPVSEEAIMPLIVAMLLTKYPSDLVTLRSGTPLRLRTLAAFVHSFAHFARLLRSLDAPIPAGLARVVQFDQALRQQWQAAGTLNWQKIVDGTDLMLEATADLLGWVDRRLTEIGVCEDGWPAPENWNPVGSLPVRFIEGWSPDSLLGGIAGANGPDSAPKLLFPKTVGTYLGWLSKASGVASRRLREELQIEFALGQPPGLARFARYRDALNALVAHEQPHRAVPKYIGLTHFYPATMRSQPVEDLTALRDALDAYRQVSQGYPDSGNRWDGFYSNWGRSTPDWIPGLVPQYLQELPRDPRRNDVPDQQYLYRSDGKDYKLISHYPEDHAFVRATRPELLDPVREGWAYGFWTEGAANW